jgi:hypothetical protein
MSSRKCFIIILILLITCNVFADSISLKSGKSFPCRITGYDVKSLYVIMDNGKKLLVTKTKVDSLSSGNYTNSILNTFSKSFPNDRKEYTEYDDLDAYLNNIMPVNHNELFTNTGPLIPYSEAYLIGIKDAKSRHFSGTWFTAGLASGFLLGLIGTAVITIAAGKTNPKVVPENCDYKGYNKGYTKQTKKVNRICAFTGGILGTAAIVAVMQANPQKNK